MLLGGTTATTEITDAVNKSSKLKFNPNSGKLSTTTVEATTVAATTVKIDVSGTSTDVKTFLRNELDDKLGAGFEDKMEALGKLEQALQDDPDFLENLSEVAQAVEGKADKNHKHKLSDITD